MGSASWDPFLDRFGTKSPLMGVKNPKFFAPAAQKFSVLPLEIIKIWTPECKIFGRRRRIFTQNASRNHQKHDFFCPPEAA